MNEKDKLISAAIILLLLLSTVVFALRHESDDDESGDIDHTALVLEAAMTYMESPKVVVTASSLHDDMHDGITNNDPFLLDIRSFEDYANGHIPGSVNIPFRSVFDPDNLGKLPNDKRIVVICYTGHTASQITALLNIAGYDAIALKFGFQPWAEGEHDFNPAVDAHDYEIVSGPEPGSWSKTGTRCGGDDDDDDDTDDPDPDPGPGDEPSGDEGNAITVAADTYLREGKPPAIAAPSVRDNLNDEDRSNDPFILDIRDTADYETGHIPGSVNIPFKSVLTTENLSRLPKNRQIVVVCYTGHTASQITALLNVVGYDAIALKFGFEGWKVSGKAFDPEKDRMNYEVVFSPIPIAHSYMQSGKPAVMVASNLHGLLNDTDDTNDPFVLDIRGNTDYLNGYINGSTNIPFREVFQPSNLATLPLDQQIVVVCYTGHTASQTAALLNMAGYDAVTLKFGFESWAVGGHTFDAAKDYPVEIGPVTRPDPCETPGVYIDNVATASDTYLASGKGPVTLASSLQEKLKDGNTANDPFLLDIRSSGDFQLGHVPGSVNIPYRSVFSWDNITLLPTGRQIVVVCYTGHTASQTTAMLNLAGYDAVALKFGFESWKDSGHAFDPENHRMNYEVVVDDTQ